MKKITTITRKMFLCFVVCFSFLNNLHAQDSQWHRTNIGGGGAMNFSTAGPTGTILVATDLGGAYIKRSSDQQWQIIGVASGLFSTHVISAAFHPTNPNILFLATDGGIYRSSDEGRNFNLVIGGDHRVFHFIAFSPSNPGIVYASVTPRYNRVSGDDGFLAPVIMRSNDGGFSFNVVSRPQNSSGISSDTEIVGTKIIIHPQNPDVVAVLSTSTRFINIPNPNIYFTTDGGSSWRKIGNETEPTDFIFHPTAPHYAYLAYKNTAFGTAGIKFSTNATTNVWHEVFDSRFSPTGANPHLLLWPQQNNGDPTLLRAFNIYTSWYHDLPRQAAWRIKNTNGTSDFNSGWQVEGLGNVEQWAGTAENWYFGWSKIHSILNPGSASRATTIGFDLSDSNKLYWVTNQFVFSVTDNDDSSLAIENLTTRGNEKTGWQSTGLDNITPFILEINKADSNVIYTGLNDLGCLVSLDGGNHWRLCIHDTDQWPGIDGHSYGGVVTALASDPMHPGRVWMFAAGDQGLPVLPYYSNDYGKSWVQTDSSGFASTNEIYGMSIDPTSPVDNRHMYVTIDGKVYRSTNHGNTWHMVFNCNSGCRTTAIDPQTGKILAGGESGLFVSSNGDTGTWQVVLAKDEIAGFNLGQVFNRGRWGGVSTISFDENHSNKVLVAVFQENTSQGVYACNISELNNKSQVCQLILGDVAYIRDVAIDPHNSDVIYASSSSAYTSGGFRQASGGLFRTIDGGENWQQVNEGLEWPMVIPIAIKPDNSSKVFIGSPGGGFYWRDFKDSITDTDSDGIADAIDNCIFTPNPDQRDSNNDGFGNLCDADLDNSGFVNFADLALFKSGFGTNNADADFDNNGFVNFADLTLFKSLFGKAPGPSGTGKLSIE
jgi:photosystem II stability/assembly factor-like uncharacterized protein